MKMLSFLLEICTHTHKLPGVELLGHSGKSMLNFVGKCPNYYFPFHIPAGSVQSSNTPILSTACNCYFYGYAILVGWSGIILGFDLHFPGDYWWCVSVLCTLRQDLTLYVAQASSNLQPSCLSLLGEEHVITTLGSKNSYEVRKQNS